MKICEMIVKNSMIILGISLVILIVFCALEMIITTQYLTWLVIYGM